MKRLDRFILKSFIGPFFGILVVVVFILMMQFLWVYIDDLVGKGLGLKVILEFVGWGGATLLPLSLPLASLLASVMTVGQMTENFELTAIKAAGISFVRVIMPMFIATIFICIGAFYAANDLVPVAYNKIYTLRDDIGRTKEEINIPTGTFYDGIDGYILRVDSKNKATGMMYDVMVYDHTKKTSTMMMTLADSAMIRMSDAKDYLTFELFDGANYQETNKMNYKDTILQLQKVDFSRQEMVIRLENYAFNKSSDVRYSDQVRSMNQAQLLHGKDSVTHLKDSALVAQASEFMHKRILRYASQLDTTVKERLPDAKPMALDGFGEWKSLKDERIAYEAAISQAEDYSSALNSNESAIYEHDWLLRRIDVEYLKKFAGALACLIMFLIGAPLGASVSRKSGLGAYIIVAVLFFVLYWVVDITGIKLARGGAAPAPLGVFVSTLVLLPTGLFLTWKAIHDSALVSTENSGAAWRRIKSKIKSMFRKTRIVYMGTPEFAVAPLDALIKAEYNVVGVVTVADKPSGRGLKVNESAVKKYAVEHDIPVLQPVKLKDPEFLSQLAAFKADLFVVVAFRMLPEQVWTMPPLGTFNLHAALLPQYRGAAPLNWAVINGEKITGVTTFMIDKDIDTGGIMLRQEYRIKDTDTVGDVHDALMPIGASLVVETVQGIIEKSIETRVQRSFIQGSEVLRPAPKLTRELCHVDWNDTTKHVYDLIRGLSPYPTAFTELVKDGSAPVQLKIFGTEKVMGEEFAHMLEVSGKASAAPGEILSDGKTFFAVATSDGAISVRDLQLAGKKRMEVGAFLAGFREPCSYVTTPGTSAAEIARTRA